MSARGEVQEWWVVVLSPWLGLLGIPKKPHKEGVR
jgi:hypothetical protein